MTDFAVKLTAQGVLIYAAMAAYLLAFVFKAAGAKKLGAAAYLLGFATAAAAFAYRWWHAGHVPLSNLFEVFLCLGLLIWPLSYFCLRFLRVGGVAADCLIGVIVLFPAGFVFHAGPQKLPPALQSWLFAPHVAAYMIAYVVLAKAGVQAAAGLARARPADAGLVSYELGAYKMVMLGFPLLTLGLLLGAAWGKRAWGDWWNWDPKELWSFVSWLIYAGYLHFRYLDGRRHPRVGCALVVAGLVAVVITLLWVNLARIFEGLHSYA